MKVGPLLVGAGIGGLVWVVALRTTARAASAASGATTPAPDVGSGPTTPPPSAPDGLVRDSQGNIIGDDSGPVTSPAAGTTDMAVAASAATDKHVSIVQGDAVSTVGVDGQSGSATPMTVDGETKTVQRDHNAPLGGRGVEQMAATTARTDAPAMVGPGAQPSSEALYNAYLIAASGTTNGMTDPEIAALLSEGAEVGGLSL